MEVLLALVVAAPVAILAWLVWAPLRIQAAGVASTERPSAGMLAVGWWPLRVTLEASEEAAVVKVHLFGLRVWRGLPEEAGSAPVTKHTGRWVSAWGRRPSRRAASELARFARAQLRQIRLDRLRGRLRFGCEEPDDTGAIDGWLWSLRAVHPATTATFEHEAIWVPGLHLDAGGELRVRFFVGRVMLAAIPLAIRLGRAERPAQGEAELTMR